MDSKKPFHKSIFFWLMVLILLYSSLGFFAVPYFIEKKLTSIISKNLNSEFQSESIQFNPFTISASVNNTEIISKDGTKWFQADAIYVNLNLWKTLFSDLSINTLELRRPYYYLLTENSKSEAKYPQIHQDDSTDSKSDISFEIDKIAINSGSVSYKDTSSNKELDFELNKIIFNQQKFSTNDQDTHFDLEFETRKQEIVRTSGVFNYAKMSLLADWHINNFNTGTIFEIIGDSENTILGLRNHSGTFTAQGRLSSSNLTSETAIINIEKFDLENLKTQSQNLSNPEFHIIKAAISGIRINPNTNEISVKNIISESDSFKFNIDNQNYLLWPELTEWMEVNNDAENTDEWKFNINSIRLNNSIIRLYKQRFDNDFKNSIKITELNLNNISNQVNSQTEFDTDLLIEENGHIAIDGNLTLTPFNLMADVKVEDLNIVPLNHWLPENLSLNINQGYLFASQSISMENEQISAHGSVKLQNVELTDENKSPFLSFNTLDVSETKINSEKQLVQLNKIILDHAQGNLIVSDQKQLNLNTLKASENIQPEQPAENNWIIEIGSIDFIEAQTQLTDYSIEPHYETMLSSLNGTISGLSTDNLSKADIELSGLLDTYGKVSIKGQINPLSEQAFTDISIDIDDVDLQNFSGYSGKYLGFPVNKGKVDMELQYKLNQKHLKGSNKLIFQQLEFGNKTASQDAVNLPLKMATGLLTDGNGIMKINLPVSGNIDDPEFSYGGLIFKAFFKLITGIVASPFKLLGKLVPDGDNLDLNQIDFIAGKSELQTGESEKLKAMKVILEKRPSLILEITGIINITEDQKALRTQKLLKQMSLTQKPDWNNPSHFNTLKQLYFTVFSKKEWDVIENSHTKEDGSINLISLSEKAWKHLLDKEEIDKEIETLGKNRSQFIQQQLIEIFSISADRVFIKTPLESQDLKPQVKFSVTQ